MKAKKLIRMQFTIGGFFNDNNYFVSIEENKLTYYNSPCPGEPFIVNESGTTEVSDSAIAALLKAMEDIKVYKWKGEYHNNNICDGQQWELEIETDLYMVQSYGSNQYPGGKGMNYSNSFRILLNALHELTGMKIE
jgi:hypothetical protein